MERDNKQGTVEGKALTEKSQVAERQSQCQVETGVDRILINWQLSRKEWVG